MAMKRIPKVEQSLLCASVYIKNFKRVVEELVYNSLDAESSSIAIRVCLQESFIQVLDNGNGILEDNFSLLGQKYATSKYVDVTTLKSAPDKYGYRGLSLASIVDVSQSVTVCSRTDSSPDTWVKTFHNGKEKDICRTVSRPSKGTTVEIKGFLYNLNIQRKSIEPHNELQNIKIALQQLALVHCSVSISLRDDSKNDILFQIHKNRNIYKTLKSLFQINEKDFQELQVEKNEYKVKAFIGKKYAQTNNYYQWIYLNGKFIQKSLLHKKLNDSLSTYLRTRNISKNTHDHKDETNYLNFNNPFYFIFISCPNYDFDMTYNSEKCLVEFKDWKEVNKLIEKLTQFYLGAECLITGKPEINNIESKENPTGTKIKEIVEKILNNKKNPRISQLKNEVKGNIRKRKRKKQIASSVSKILDKNTEIVKPCNQEELSGSMKINDQQLLNHNLMNIKNMKGTQIITGDLKKQMMQPEVPQIQKIKKRVNDKNFSLTNKFKAPTKSLKKRCKQLNRKVLQLLHNIFKNAKKDTINYKIPNQGTIKNNKSFHSNETKVHMQESMSKQSNNLNLQPIKKSFDLIKTVVTSQYEETNLFPKNNTTNQISHCYEGITKHNSNDMFIPTATFNSHSNYRHQSERKNETSYYIRNTHNNLLLKKQKIYSALNKTNSYKNKQIQQSSRHNPKRNSLNFDVQELQEFTYPIEMCNNDELLTCKQKYVKCNNDSEFYYNLPRRYEHTNFLNFGNTYTLNNTMRSSGGNPFNATYSLKCLTYTVNYSSSCYYLNDISASTNEINYVENETEKENNVVSQAKSGNCDTISNRTEPINLCEVVLQDVNDDVHNFESEFENSYNYVQENNSKDDNSQISKCLNQLTGEHKHSLNIYNSPLMSNNINCVQDLENNKVLKHHRIANDAHEDTEPKSLNTNNIKCNTERIFDFQLERRHHFMPKGMSPISSNCRRQNALFFNGDEICYKDIIYENFANDVVLHSEIFEPEVQNIKKLFSKEIEKFNGYVQKQKGDLIFDSLSLKQAKVLGQIDRKFIATVVTGRSSQTDKSSQFLVLFDQHAVDERIRLERNLTDYMQDSQWKSIDIDPVTLILSKEDYLYFVNHKNKLAQFGLQWTFKTDTEILLNAIPKAILGKNPRQVEIVINAVKKLISEQIKAIKSLRGNVYLYPKSIMELVFSEACRYAIKFGDKLSKRECLSMIDSLSYCNTPFQCAHGRPVMAVLLKIPNNNRKYMVNIAKIKILQNI